MPRIHVSLTGQEIKYDDPDPKLTRFLQKAFDLASDPKVKSDALVALIYGTENPILDRTLFPERGMVTKDVLENPVYHVLTDLLARKEAQQNGTNLTRVAAKYTLSVAEAAKELGVHEDAVRRAIRGRRLPAWVKDGAYFVQPEHLQLLGEVGRRGPMPAAIGPLKVWVGYLPNASMLIQRPGGQLPDGGSPGTTIECDIPRWRRVAVLTAGHNKLRMFVLEPGPDADELEFHGFFVRGNFKIVEKINSSAAARKAWESFKAS